MQAALFWKSVDRVRLQGRWGRELEGKKWLDSLLNHLSASHPPTIRNVAHGCQKDYLKQSRQPPQLQGEGGRAGHAGAPDTGWLEAGSELQAASRD